jgi:hypothetical protein
LGTTANVIFIATITKRRTSIDLRQKDRLAGFHLFWQKGFSKVTAPNRPPLVSSLAGLASQDGATTGD